MAARKNFNQDEFILFLNKIYKNLNLNNKEYIQFLIDTYYVDNMHGTYYLTACKNQFFNFNNSNAPKAYTYIKYWTNRGWSVEDAKQKIRSKYEQSEIFFTKEEIYNYVISSKCGNFNIDNKEFIKKFVDYIQFDDHIFYYQILEWIAKWSKQYYDTQNAGYVTAKKEYWLSRGYSEEESIQLISKIQKEKSPRSVEYYKKKGLSDSEAKIEVTKIQSKYANMSKSTYEYWKNLGLDEDTINEKVKYYNELRSVWGKKYWQSLGYTDDESSEMVKYYNASCPECFKYNGDYTNYTEAIKKFKDTRKNIWKSIRNSGDVSKIKGGCISHVSKAENKCFDFLKKYIDETIEHTPYIIIFPDGYESSIGNQVFYACDGYMIYKNKYIIIEFDGGIGVYHYEEQDKKRDNDILCLDDNVLGILRIQDTFFKYKDVQIMSNKINDALSLIKQGVCERIILNNTDDE